MEGRTIPCRRRDKERTFRVAFTHARCFPEMILWDPKEKQALIGLPNRPVLISGRERNNPKQWDRSDSITTIDATLEGAGKARKRKRSWHR